MQKANSCLGLKTISGILKVAFLGLGFLFLLSLSTALAKPPYLVMGYLPDYETGVSPGSLSWGDMTHVIECFAEPNSNGTIYFQYNQMSGLISTAHNNGTRVLLSFGGEAGAAASTWESAIGSYQSTFISNIMNQVKSSGYDGVDIDWEFPGSGDESAFTSFMSALASALHSTNGYDGKPRQLTFFISPGYYICGVNWSVIGQYADYGILSGYAYGCDSFNGPLNDTCAYTDCFGVSRQASVVNSVQRLAGLGFSEGKLIMGIPMYSTQGNTISSILSGTLTQYFSTQAEATYGSNTGVDNAQSYCDKVNWMAGQSPKLPGIAMWEIGQAYPPTSSAVAPVWAALGDRSGCINYGSGSTPPTNTPTPKPSNPTPTHTPTPKPSNPTPTNTPSKGQPTATFTYTPTPPPSSGGGCSGVPAWNGNFVAYAAGAEVTYDGELYKCIQAHTSEPNWTPAAVPALWQALGSCSSGAASPAIKGQIAAPAPAAAPVAAPVSPKKK
jgi:hypothetical protein